MISKNQVVTILILAFLSIAGIAAIKAPAKDHKNLKILPADISDQQLDSIMQSYCKALSVSCDFCHARFKNLPDSLDYASDQLPMKENARQMIRMTIYINGAYFSYEKGKKPEEINVIRCMTCHHGVTFPLE